MPHFPKPHFRASRGHWYVELDKRQINLGPDEEAAFQEYYRLMDARANKRPVQQSPDEIAVATVIAKFLDWSEKHSKTVTYGQHKRYLGAFLRNVGTALLVRDLIPNHLTEWLDGFQSLGDPGRREAIGCVKRAMNWAVDEGLLKVNPIARMKRPPKTRREVFLTTDQVESILELCRDDNLRDLIRLAIETGSRPGEVCRTEKRHILGDKIVLPTGEHKTGKKTKLPRIIYLTPEAKKIVAKWAERNPEGAIFRNSQGRAWTIDAINCRLRRMRQHGLPEGACMYAFRHTYATTALENGVHPEELRILLGHQDLSMIARHYSHLAKQDKHIAKAAVKARAKVSRASSTKRRRQEAS